MTSSIIFNQMATSQYSFPISLIRQYCFCPRIPFFNEVLNINPGDRPWQKQGIAYHERQRILNRRRTLKRYGLKKGTIHHNVWLAGSIIPCHGICDAIVETPETVSPVEFKMEASRPNRGQILQLAAYGMLAREKFEKKCSVMFILYGNKGKVRQYTLDDKIEHEVKNVVCNILRSIKKGLLPISAASAAQCSQCEYLNFCADRETITSKGRNKL